MKYQYMGKVVCPDDQRNDNTSLFMTIEDEAAGIKIATDDILCRSFRIFEAGNLIRTRRDMFEGFDVGEVVPFSGLEAGSQIYNDLLNDETCTHVFYPRASEVVVFIGPDYGAKIYGCGGEIWPVSREKFEAEKTAKISAGRDQLKPGPVQYDMV